MRIRRLATSCVLLMTLMVAGIPAIADEQLGGTIVNSTTISGGVDTSINFDFSHPLFLDVLSTSDGNGNFTYAISGSTNNSDFAFYFTPGSGTISLQGYAILEIQSPPDWEGSVGNDGLVTWQYSGSTGAWIDDAPLTFGLQSSITTATIYDAQAVYPRGAIAGPYYEFGNSNNGGLGSASFSFIGPEVPEPSATAFLAVGATMLAWKKRSRRWRVSGNT